jgi:transcription elongation factor Elf1
MQGHPMSQRLSKDFTCPNCRSQSVVYPDALADEAGVICRSCGTSLGTLAQFRRLVEQRPAHAGIPPSGC